MNANFEAAAAQPPGSTSNLPVPRGTEERMEKFRTLLPKAAALPFRRASGPTAQAGSLCHPFLRHALRTAVLLMPLVTQAQPGEIGTIMIHYSPATGIGLESGVMRRDPSDIIKVGDLYYVWFTKGKVSAGYDSTVWYATSPDGHAWTEKGECIPRGLAGSWDEQSAFTPNILVAQGKYWLFYTGVPKPFSKTTKTAIGMAVSDSPDGPWKKLEANPVLKPSANPEDFDSMRIDDACLIVRGGKYWFYYKGRQLGKSPAETKLGVAMSDHPGGPYMKHAGNPVVHGNHEVLVWPQGKGVAAMIGTVGPKEITRSILFAEDGLHFSKTHNILNVPTAAGAYRPEAFTDSGTGRQIEWGVHVGTRPQALPFIERFDMTERK